MSGSERRHGLTLVFMPIEELNALVGLPHLCSARRQARRGTSKHKKQSSARYLIILSAEGSRIE
jgi:hypothetical protein